MTTYPLHYVGNRVYRPDVFRWEAKAKGVNRALPSHYVKMLHYGQAILLGIWQHKIREGKNGSRFDAAGTANVFGYFHLSAVHVQASDDFQAWMRDHLRVVAVDDGPAESVERQCGSYQIGPAIYVDNSVEEIASLCELGEAQTGEHAKLFIAGTFRDVKPRIELDPAQFTRTVVNVDVDGWAPDAEGWDKNPDSVGSAVPLRFVMDYAQRRYVPKEERERIFAKVAKDVVP